MTQGMARAGVDRGGSLGKMAQGVNLVVGPGDNPEGGQGGGLGSPGITLFLSALLD